MKKLLLVTLLSSTLLLAGCGNKENSSKQELETVTVSYEDFDVIVDNTIENNGYPTFEVKNNSDYPVPAFNAVYTNKNNKEQEADVFPNGTIMPGETTKKEMLFVTNAEDLESFNFDDYVLTSADYRYIKDDVEIQVYYDAKLETYKEMEY